MTGFDLVALFDGDGVLFEVHECDADVGFGSEVEVVCAAAVTDMGWEVFGGVGGA